MSYERSNELVIAKDAPPEIKSAIRKVDGSKVSDDKIKRMISKAKDAVKNQSVNLAGKQLKLADYIKFRASHQPQVIKVNQLPQEALDFISSVDWKFIAKQKTLYKKAAIMYMQKFITKNIPLKK